mgnify:CR=1 FL=1
MYAEMLWHQMSCNGNTGEAEVPITLDLDLSCVLSILTVSSIPQLIQRHICVLPSVRKLGYFIFCPYLFSDFLDSHLSTRLSIVDTDVHSIQHNGL